MLIEECATFRREALDDCLVVEPAGHAPPHGAPRKESRIRPPGSTAFRELPQVRAISITFYSLNGASEPPQPHHPIPMCCIVID